MSVQEILKQLHPLEQKVLPYLKEGVSVEELEQASQLKEIEVMRALQWLENKKVLRIKVALTEVVSLDKNGRHYRDHGLPEFKFLKQLDKGKKLSDIKLSDEEKNVSLGILKRMNAISITKKDDGLFLEKTDHAKTLSEEKYLGFLKSLPLDFTQMTAEQKDVFASLSQRKEMVTKEVKKIRTVSLRELGNDLLKHKHEVKATVERLTPAMLKEKSWQGKTFRNYDIKINVPEIFGGRIHPLQAVMNNIRRIFMDMGFKEMEGPWIETAFWCMDSMWIPQDHPSREVQDTFYLDMKGVLPKVAKKVGDVHEHGCKSSIKGYGYKWDPEVSKQLLLRTHTTATTYRYFGEKGVKPPAKYFYIGRIFRNEAIDATHLPEFHQVEGFVMDEGLTLRDLMGYIREFYSRIGIHKIKFKPTYNPYTEPSMEAIGYNEQLGKWVELINSGIFRPESLEPYGIDVPVIAWGLGVERLAMMLTQQHDIRNMLGAKGDLQWLRNYQAVRRV